MMIVPELQTMFILVPRTGSGSLYRELQRVYPKSMLLYRHMEADGVPHGYDRWKRIGFVRHPTARLRSLYTFLKGFGGGAQVQGGAASDDAARVRRQVEGKTFDEWLLTNNDPWTVPYDVSGKGEWWPVLTRRASAPENRLSQFAYLRPDIGTEVRKFENLRPSMKEWGLDPAASNNVTGQQHEPLSDAAASHIARYCGWDLHQGCKLI